jgi:hypothetical protein
MKTMLLAGIAALSVLSRHLSCTVNTPGIVLEPDPGEAARAASYSDGVGWACDATPREEGLFSLGAR